MHTYRTALRSHIRKLERDLSKAIKAGKPADHIRAELARSKREAEHENADA
jgi:hypothetical protein